MEMNTILKRSLDSGYTKSQCLCQRDFNCKKSPLISLRKGGEGEKLASLGMKHNGKMRSRTKCPMTDHVAKPEM
jgi:hypothetical protein